MADAGWYPDAHDPNQQHYFDGQNWTGHHRPNPDSSTAAAAAPAPDDTVRRGDLAPEQQWAGSQQPYQQQPYQQPYQQQPYQAPTQQWPQQQWAQPGSPVLTPPESGSRRKTPLVIAGVAAVAVVAGVVTFLVWPEDDAPSITYRGKGIAAAETTLTSAEKAVDKAVADRKGAKNDDTRCYFAKPKKAASGAKASDIDSSLRCGPVLYVDGVRTSAYLSVPFTDTTKGSEVELEVRDDINDIEPAALDTDLDLVRPDGEKPPTENGGAGTLTVPQPPAAEKDLLTTGPVPSGSGVKSIGTSVIGKNLGVTLVSAGEITRYGEGDDARSAPDGQRLVAFQLRYRSGDVDQSGRTAATLVSSGGTPRPIPDADGTDYVIAAVPTGGASIVLSDGGVNQSIALPSGTVGSDAIAVLQRTNRTAALFSRVSVPIALRQGSRTGSVTFRATASVASLDFWAPGNTSVRPASVKNAILSVRVNYTDDGKTYGFNPRLLKLRAAGRTYSARNIAPSGKVNNVFEVPASFTSGTLVIGGTAVQDGVTLRVRSAKSIPIRIS